MYLKLSSYFYNHKGQVIHLLLLDLVWDRHYLQSQSGMKKNLLFSLLVFFFSFQLVLAQSSARTAIYNFETRPIRNGELRILSWNIKMLPIFLKKHSHGPMKRARIIPQHIIQDQIDIIVFQEAFDFWPRRAIHKRLKDHYPYHIGPANKGIFRTNSGILIYSKFPIRHLGEVDFEDCEGNDCMAKKGALLVEGMHNGIKFQVLGTHLEAGGPPEIKHNQYQEIRDLIDQHRQDGVPQILCGDFNTHRGRDDGLYNRMIKTVDAEDGPFFSRIKHTAGGIMEKSPEKLAKKRKKGGQVIDFALYRGNGHSAQWMERYVRDYKERWSADQNELSDHLAVLLRIIL